MAKTKRLNSVVIAEIKRLIVQGIPDAEVHVLNPNNDNVHFECVVVSASFENQSLVKQHKAVLQALKQEFDNNVVHALAVKTYTPDKWMMLKG